MDALWNAQFALAPALAWALLHSLWQGALLAVLAGLVLGALAGRSAALRHTIGLGFLLAMVGSPLVSFIAYWQRPAAELNAGLLPAITAPAIGATPGLYVQESGSLAGILSLLWLLGVFAMLLRQFGGLRLVGALEMQSFETLPPEWQQRVHALQRALGISRQVVVRLAGDIASPFTARLLRPVIWLPLSLIARLPVEQLEALIAHELAHIRRLDWLWNGLQCVVESLLFYHPAAWWLSRRIRQEREHACDDLAVAACGNAIALAEALADLERERHPFPRLLLAADGGSLMQRISRLLNGSTSSSRWRLPAGLLVLLVSGTLLATTVDLSGPNLPSIRIVSSTDGTLRPGDTREVRANGLDKKRYYRASVDAQGRVSERYEEDGQARPIDAGVREWISEVSRISVPPPPPPAPPAPPALASLPAPPAPPPAPPAPPELTDSATFKEILRLVAADKAVAARAGHPLTVDPATVDGNIRLTGRNDSEGSARLSFELRGPKGRIGVLVAAERNDGAWKLLNLDLRPASR